MDMLRGTIITSKCADRMLRRVSPIYDNSYVGLWIFEAIGREYDKLWEIVDTFAGQMHPSTATWALELWEQRYGITPSAGQTEAERRRVVASARGLPNSFTPAALENLLANLTGSTVFCDDCVGPYTFGVCFETAENQPELDYALLKSTINKHKPSHLSYEIYFQCSESVVLKVETAYWRYVYSFAGTALTGQLPDTAQEGAAARGGILLLPRMDGYIIPYDVAGTIPDIALESGVSSPALQTYVQGAAFPTAYTPCGSTVVGAGI